MYRYTVPLDTMTFAISNRESIAKTLQEMKVSRVMLCGCSYFYEREKKRIYLDTLKEGCKFLKSRGFEVGAWKWTFLDPRCDTDFLRMRLPTGKESAQSVCPSDSRFRKFAADFICDIAECGVDLIMLDDDFRYGNLDSSIGCLCDNHLAYMSELLGERVTLDVLGDKLFVGGANKYRSAWLKSKRHFFELFAKEMRAALDKVAPEVRLGLCSSYCSWDQDGITPYEIAKMLAGNTKPFLRLAGAPFWAARRSPDNQTLQDTVEFSRLQLSYIDEVDGIEVFSEGDTYPRPRLKCSASYLEGFDQALRAAGGSSGILKYTMDYTSSERYETGYNERHLKNLPIYEKIDEMFGTKECIGVRVFEHREKYENIDVPPHVTSERELDFMTAFSYAARMLAAASVPTVYKDVGTVSAVFGENAKYLPLSALKNGVILDARAAEILTERGVDVGLKEKGERLNIVNEKFTFDGEDVGISGAFAYELKLREGIKIESTFTTFDTAGLTLPYPIYRVASFYDRRDIIGSYTYENSDGERFLVFSFDGQRVDETIFRSYARADQLKRIIPYLGKGCGFTVCTSPNLYVIAKREGERIAIGLWNFSLDSVERPFIRLEDGIDACIVSTAGCSVELCDGVIELSRIEPFGFAAVEYELS